MFKITKQINNNNTIFSDGSFLFNNNTNLLQKHKNKIYEQDLKNEQKFLYSKLNLDLNETVSIKNLNYRKKIFK
jgi:hypothetical protein